MPISHTDKFKAGHRILHPEHGEGTIIGYSTRVDFAIHFRKVGVRVVHHKILKHHPEQLATTK